MISRRKFLSSTAAISVAFPALRCTSLDTSATNVESGSGSRFGPLLKDPEGIIALPEGFSYKIISRHGEKMSDGFFVPSKHDGMGTLSGPNGLTVLIRNHEVVRHRPEDGPFGHDLELLSQIDQSLLYDAGTGGAPPMGGTTTLLYDTKNKALVSHHLSLAGTIQNCAGGVTPWGSWISCEEIVNEPGEGRAKEHGYNFEVPSDLNNPLVRPEPLKAMGRFKHEAIAVHPGSGVVYQTEDLNDGLLYRFIPNIPGQLNQGGRLEALSIRGNPSLDIRNFNGKNIEKGEVLEVDWIELDDVESPDDDLRHRGFDAGAARFAHGEGIFYGEMNGTEEVYIACTEGGEARLGQIWKYRPSSAEGTPQERNNPATLELFVEADSGTILENGDNLTVSPWGDLIVCEDGTGDDYLLGITPAGEVYKLARNLNGNGEFAGACFSPDGSTFFVNMQVDGWTLAINGPW